MRIGPHRFDADGAALHGPSGIVRLEERAARTLALLGSRRGEVVSKAAILDAVWNGRVVSANSVAVVIADLRRALGDDARAPRYLETVPKRGYRLHALTEPGHERDVPAPRSGLPGRSRLPRRAGAIAAAALLVVAAGGAALGGAALWPRTGSRSLVLLLQPVRNDTGSPAADRTARALSELVRLRASRMPGVVVVAAGGAGAAPDASEVLSATLVLWNGLPTLSLSVSDVRTGVLRWAAMAEGPPLLLTAHTLERLDEFARRRRPVPLVNAG